MMLSKASRALVGAQTKAYLRPLAPAMLNRGVSTTSKKEGEAMPVASENSADAVSKAFMTNSEAFVETLAARGVTDVFGIVGSAFMDSLDLFDSAGIRFISVAHEQNAAHMADGFSRVTDRHGVCIGQNGPGISNFVTGVAAAYHAHSPVVVITPEAGTATSGLGGFQETEQLPMFSKITKWQAHVNNPTRIAELTGRSFDYAMTERGPVQLNIPRDYFYGEGEFTIPKEFIRELGPGGENALGEAAELIANAKNPVIISGGGVVMGNAVNDVKALAEYLNAPVCTTYLHNDAFPASHPLACGPLGYQGYQSAMHAVRDADVVIAVGSRLGPFGTNPQYGIDYWPKDAKIVQIDADHRRLSLVKPATVGIHGDAGAASKDLLGRLQKKSVKALNNTEERLWRMNQYKQEWSATLDDMTYGPPSAVEGMIKPRAALRELMKAKPEDAMVATDIGNTCSVSNSYLEFEHPKSFLAAMTYGNCGYAFPAAIGAKVARPDRPAISYAGEGAWGMSLPEVMTCVREKIPTTAVVFNNGQWGAEKKNQVLWFGDRYVGTQLENPSFAAVAKAMNAEGIVCTHVDQVGDALKEAVRMQMEEGKTCVVELMTTKELGDPFRRDAMKLPQRVLSKYAHKSESSESATGQPVDLQK
eukprot:GFYU01002821.1.p1 GENE.GFYU01002821.1~~GFYU01002821.1.p1  ORF type:complete len:646 (-),score=243.27 GFYU01002821.1:438-2375(-)